MFVDVSSQEGIVTEMIDSLLVTELNEKNELWGEIFTVNVVKRGKNWNVIS